MALDYSNGCVNFRDAGEWVNLLAGCDLVPLRRILRGGKLTAVTSADEIGRAGTIVNLRNGPDPDRQQFGADYWHFPISNTHEKYETTDPVVREWLTDVFACLAHDVERLPVLIPLHVRQGSDGSGRGCAPDRTRR